jgi:hypothetical protein
MSQDQVQIAGVVVADATREGCPLTYVSPGFEQLTGYAAADVLGRKVIAAARTLLARIAPLSVSSSLARPLTAIRSSRD